MSLASASRLFTVLRHPLRSYNEVAKKAPFYTGVVTTALKTSAADMFAQKVMEKREEMDWRRHAMFCSFGFVYLGMAQYYLYNVVFRKLCAPITKVAGHLAVAPIKTFIDQCIHHPFGYFPAFYLLKGALENRSYASTFQKYKEDLWPNLKALWMVWVPCQLINFGYVPAHLRIPFAAGVSFVWTVIISGMRGAVEVQNHGDHALLPVDPDVIQPNFGAVTHSLLPGRIPTMGEMEGVIVHARENMEEAIEHVMESMPHNLVEAFEGMPHTLVEVVQSVQADQHVAPPVHEGQPREAGEKESTKRGGEEEGEMGEEEKGVNQEEKEDSKGA